MGVRGFEQRLERLVEGAFARAFRSGLEPVEIARKLVRAVDAGRRVGVHGPIAPNHVLVALSTADARRFEAYADVIEHELATELRDHARQEGYRFVGPVRVQLVEDPALRQGDLDIEATIRAGPGGRVGTLVLPDGRRVPLGERPLLIGRLPDCDLPTEDPRVSRRHAEIRPEPEGYAIIDLGSLNGTTVNGVPVKEHLLADGDVIGIGALVLRFEMA